MQGQIEKSEKVFGKYNFPHRHFVLVIVPANNVNGEFLKIQQERGHSKFEFIFLLCIICHLVLLTA